MERYRESNSHIVKMLADIHMRERLDVGKRLTEMGLNGTGTTLHWVAPI